MRNVFLLAERMQDVKNWAKHVKIDLKTHPNIRLAINDEGVLSKSKDGFFVVISWPRNGEKIVDLLRLRGYEKLSDDINEWPLDVFT